jgi:hypothetical protein
MIRLLPCGVIEISETPSGSTRRRTIVIVLLRASFNSDSSAACGTVMVIVSLRKCAFHTSARRQ